jgi:hypothetical protein
VGVLLWLGRTKEHEKPPAADAPLVRSFTEESVRKIELACSGATVGLERATSGEWQITRPFEAAADPRRVHEIVAALQDARVRKVIAETAAEPGTFGLAPPACILRLGFAAGTAALELRLGRASPVGSERYATGDDARVVLTDGSLYGLIARGAEALREKRLIPLDPEAIARIALDRPDGRVVVALMAGSWRLEAPYRDAASSGACSSLARAVTSLECAGSGPLRPPIHARAERRLKVTVTAKDGSLPVVAFVAAAGVEGKRLGWKEDRALAGLVEESVVRELEHPSESFRDPRITLFSSPDVRRLAIERGDTTLRIERNTESSPWTGSEGSGAFPVDGKRVDTLLEQLRNLTGLGFEPAPPATPATGTITLAGAAGELARLTWGPLQSAATPGVVSVWLTTPSRPGVVFRVVASGFGPIPAKAADLAETTTSASANP